MIRRDFVRGAASVTGAVLSRLLLPTRGRAAPLPRPAAGPPSLSGSEFDLTVHRMPIRIDGRSGDAIGINGSVPGPTIRWREGDEVVIRVTNELEEDTSIHWHGILLPFHQDGVPGVSFPGIPPGSTFTYRFPVRQSGTYWYHSHSGLQEQSGHYGALVITPAGTDAVAADREHVLVLSDWTFVDPHRLFAELKKDSHSLQFGLRGLPDLIRDARRSGWRSALEDRRRWGRMRMSPTDIADVGAPTYAYLVNGRGPDDGLVLDFGPGERVRLRIINAAAMTHFNVRIPGLPLTVVEADGVLVAPVETDELQIGVAETYDVVVEPGEDRAYAFVAEAMDRSGMASATLAPRPGMTAPRPALRERPLLTMRDMGMDMGADMSMPDMAMGGHAGHHPASPPAHAHSADPVTHAHLRGTGVANLTSDRLSRLDEPGIGLDREPHRTLAYSELVALEAGPDPGPPDRELELHLTGNMHRYMWGFDGRKFSEIAGPIVFREGERVRLNLVNDTMMAHPIHLHGMFVSLISGHGRRAPLKHTVVVKPAETLTVEFTAAPAGDWAFHCHLLYHMHAGMMHVVSILPPESADTAGGAR